MPRPKNAEVPAPAPKSPRNVVGSPWRQDAIPTREERKQREREAHRHDGLCVRQEWGKWSKTCYCKCRQCWDKVANACICSHCTCRGI